MCDVIKATFRSLDYTASRTRSSHGERCDLLSVVGMKRSVILLSISSVHKVVRRCALPLEESNWTKHVSERAARMPKGHNNYTGTRPQRANSRSCSSLEPRPTTL